MNIAVVGYGYWGPNLVRNFSWAGGVNVKYVCDLSQERLDKAKSQFPNIENTTTDYNDVLNDPSVDAVVIATQVFSHYELSKKALLADKHVLVEKPLTDKAETARELVELAKEKNKILMVDHTFLFTGAVSKIKELISTGMLGEVYYFDSVRVNLGLFQSDINVVWDLAPHDLSILLYVIDKKPVSVSATGVAHVNDLENIAYINIYYDDNTIAHFHVNWLSPVKVRKMLICGSEKMVVYDDMESTEKIKVYDKGVDIEKNNSASMYNSLVQYRTGDVFIPKLDGSEALLLECKYFVECITNNKQPINDGKLGLQIVEIIEAAQQSIKEKGKIINLS